MAMSPFEEAMAAQAGRQAQPISPSEEAEALRAEEEGRCPCCGQKYGSEIPSAPF